MICDAAVFSRIGTRHANEDGYAFWRVGGTFFAIVADGLGGMGGGAEASSYVVEFMRVHALRPDITAADLAALARDSHRGLQVLQQRSPELRSMATTLTLMAVREGELVAAHCGDSRLYHVGRAGVVQVTEDHSEAQRLFKEGRLTPAELASYPRKYILESAIGIPGDPVVQAIRRDVDAGDWLVLATDGAYGLLTAQDFADAARRSRTARRFAAICLARVEARGPHDNYTMVVARVGGRGLPDALRRLFARAAGGGGSVAPAPAPDL